jgi:hypothetical protein
VTCAQDVQANSTLFTIVREVEKEVVLLESSTTIATPEPMAMQVDSNTFQPMAMPNTEERVLKSIKKLEVQILCAQHNPVCLVFSHCIGQPLIFVPLGRCSSKTGIQAGKN